jgi:MFS family permease
MFSSNYKRYVLAAMSAVYMLNLVDRGLMIILLQPIKQDFHLSDTQLGFLTGISFALFYATAGIPIARWADRGNRATITALSIGLWGIVVMACLFVTSYVQLLIARIGAAVGEAGCKPPAYSLVGDYFTGAAERTRAMSIFLAASSLSTLASLVLGGWLNERYGWRATFFLLGTPGLVLALIVKLTVVEPRTKEVSRVVPQAPLMAVFQTIWRQRAARHLCFAVVCLYTMTLGLGPWYAAFMIRSHHMGTGELGLWLGLIFAICGFAGGVGGGYLATHLYKDDERGQMRFTAITVASLFPFYLAFLLLPEKHQALLVFIPLATVLSMFLGPTYALLQRLVPDEMRATVMAAVMLLTNLIGMGLGPQIVGILSDLFMPAVGDDSLRYAMLIMSLMTVWAGYHFWRVSQVVGDDLKYRSADGAAPVSA